MRKFLLIFFFLGLIFLAVGVVKEAEAAAHTDYMQVTYNNTVGTIPITVYYYFVKAQIISGVETGVNTTFGSGSVTLSTGANYGPATVASISHNPDTEGGANYYMHWATNCEDPPVKWSGFQYDAGTGNFKYSFTSQEVSCKTTNGEPAITSISCPTPGDTLSFSWQMTGGGPYNVAKYHLFRSVSPDSNPDNNYIETITTSSSSGSKSWSGLTSGSTYYVRVSAESPQGGWSSPAYSSTPCQSLTAPPAPTNLQTFNVPSCTDTTLGGSSNNNGNPPNIKNTWTNGSGTTKTSYQLWRGNTLSYDSGDAAAWTAFWHWNLWTNNLYTWRVRNGNSVGWSTWVYGQSWNVPLCSNPPWTPGNLNSTVPSCSDTPYTASFTWQSIGGPSPTKTEFKIGSGGAVTSWAFAKYSHSVSGFQPNTSYQWYVRFGNNEGWSDWNREHVGDFSGVPSCTLPDLIISSLTTDKSTYLLGVDTTVTVTIQMKNHGFVAVTQNSPFTVFGAEPGKSATSLTTCELKTAYANMWWQDAVLPFAAGATKTYSGSFSVPATAGTYLIRSIADWGCLNTESNENNNLTDIQFQVASAPTDPANLSFTTACDFDNTPIITFSWKDGVNETGYKLEVSGDSWATSGVKNLAANTTSFVWSSTTPFDSGSPIVPGLNKTYRFAVSSVQGAVTRPRVYYTTAAGDTQTAPGDSFDSGDCRPNLQISAFSVPDGNPNEQVNATVTVVNTGKGSTATITATDSDGDGFADSDEVRMGTNPNLACVLTSTSNDEAPDPYPPDFNDNGVVEVDDVFALASRFNQTRVPLTANYAERYDLNGNGTIGIDDVFVASSRFNLNCNPNSGNFEVAINLNTSSNLTSMDDTTPEDAAQMTSPLLPGDSRTLTIPVTLPSAPQTYTAWAMVDSDKNILETDKSDNTSSDGYDVRGFDLSVSFVADSWNKPNRIYGADETAIAQVQVTNNSSSTQSFSALANSLGIWPGHSGEADLPVCSNTPPNPPHSPSSPPANGGSYDIPSLSPGQTSPPIEISFNVGNVAGTYTVNAYALFSCTPADYSWSNNSTVTTGNVTYSVQVGAWFETTGGDVGSGGTISVSLSLLPPDRYQSDYLLVGKTLDPSVRSAKWSINGYDKRLTKGKPYEYMAERFRAKAIATNTQCSIGSLAVGLNYCAGLSGPVSNGPPIGNSNTIWFIDGDLTINGNFSLPTANTMIFIVSGDITVNTTVTRADGVYIAGGTFRTTDAASGVSGSQLVINGAVYGANVNLSRKLSGTCTYNSDTRTIRITPVVCTNADSPAEVIIYNPKYLIGPNAVGLLGSPGVSWKEVAP